MNTTVSLKLDQFLKYKLVENSHNQKSTLTTYQTRNNVLKEFAEQYNVTYDRVTDQDTANDLMYYLMQEKHYKSRYVVRIRNEWFNFLEWTGRPLPKKRKLKHRDEPIVYLNDQEIKRLYHHNFYCDRLQRVADLFLILCFTGVSWCDRGKVSRSNLQVIDGARVFIANRQKSAHTFVTPLVPELERLLEKYDWKLPKICEQRFNRYIKECMYFVKIDKKVSTKTARKSAAMLYLGKSGTMELPAKVLGHVSTSTIQKHYAVYLPTHAVAAFKKAEVYTSVLPPAQQIKFESTTTVVQSPYQEPTEGRTPYGTERKAG